MADNRKKPAANKPAAKKSGGGFSGTMVTWIAVGVVVAIVATLVIIKTTSTDAGAASNGDPISTTMYKELSTIPLSVYNTVGVTSPIITVYPPTFQSGQPQLTYEQGGKTLPGGFYWGAEFCPYCAATRWGLIAALTRFGKFTNLTYMTSSGTDYAANTPTFSFLKAGYTSNYLVFKFFEVEDRSGNPLQTTPAMEEALVKKYNPKGDFPFINFGNQYIQSTAFDPATLDGTLTRSEIASSLDDATVPSTQAIVTSANYMSAVICKMTKSSPSSVCTSSGVEAAATALHITL